MALISVIKLSRLHMYNVIPRLYLLVTMHFLKQTKILKKDVFWRLEHITVIVFSVT